MIVRLISRASEGIEQQAINIDGWTLRGHGPDPVDVRTLGPGALTWIVVANVTGPPELAGFALELCAQAAGSSPKTPTEPYVEALGRLRAASDAMGQDRGVLDGVVVHMAVIGLAPGGSGVIAASGALPVYLLSGGYAARVDPLVSGDMGGLMAVEIDAGLVREVTLTSGQQLLAASMPFEDLGMELQWPAEPRVCSAEWMLDRAEEAAARTDHGGCLVAINVAVPEALGTHFQQPIAELTESTNRRTSPST